MSAKIHTQTQLIRALPAENNFPVSSLLDTSLIMSTLEDLCRDKHKQVSNIEINFVRYNPGVSCTVCYNALIEDNQLGTTDEAVLYVGSFAQKYYRQLADRLNNQSWIPGSILTSPQSVDSLHAIFYQFPNDGGIPGLKLLAEPEKLLQLVSGAINDRQALMTTSQTNSNFFYRLRYKPENRFIVRCEFNFADSSQGTKQSKSILIRFERERNSEKAFQLSTRLYEACKTNSRINLPRPLFFIPDYNLQAFEWIEAEKLSELLRSYNPDLWVRRAAHVLSSFHSCRLSGLSEMPPAYFKTRIQRTADFLAHATEEIRNLSEEIARRLNSMTMTTEHGSAELVHGDFHQGQVLVADAKDYLLDSSRAYQGDSTIDVGNFLAQLKYWHLTGRLKNVGELEQLFVDAYESPRNMKVTKPQLEYWKAVGLFELAMREFRRLKPDWPIMCERLLQECQNTLDA